MKKLVLIVAAGCLTAAGTSFAGVSAGTGVNGSLHDMTKVVPENADSMGRVCVYCHTPHHAIVQSGTEANERLPLWNRAVPMEGYLPYQWATPSNRGEQNNDTFPFDIVDPLAGPSRLCMSCHDGTIGVDSHGEAFPLFGNTRISQVTETYGTLGRSNLGTDLSTTHPIGFDYNAIALYRNSRATRGDATGTEVVDSNNGYATDIRTSETEEIYNIVTRGGKKIVDNLFGGNIMTCATCHEVHNKENVAQDPYDPPRQYTVLDTTQNRPNYFLYAKEKESLICLSCHIK